VDSPVERAAESTWERAIVRSPAAVLQTLTSKWEPPIEESPVEPPEFELVSKC